MRIMFVSTFAWPTVIGGAELTLQNLVAGLEARGHEVQVVALDPTTPPAPDALSAHDLRFPVRNSFIPDGTTKQGTIAKLGWHLRDIWNPKAARDIEGAIEAFRPDVISCHNLAGWSIAVWDVAKRHGVPIVHVLHDYYLMCVAGSMSKDGLPCTQRCARCKAFRLPHRSQSAKVAGVVAISKHMQQIFETAGYFPNAQVAQIYDVETSQPNTTQNADLSAAAFGFIGRIAPHKGVEGLLKAFVTADLPADATLTIAGTGADDYVTQLIETYQDPRIAFVGHTKPEDLYNAVTWTVVPSLSDEPLGRVVFESIGHGVPVIASRRGGIPEMVEEGKTGHLVPAGDIDALRAALESAARSGPALDRLTTAKSVTDFFDINRFLDSYERLYEAVQ